MAQHKFRVKLLGQDGSQVAAVKPPFDVGKVFGRKGRVPVKSTINGFPFRSSLMNMGEGHMMVVNAEIRQGADCRAGDTVEVAMDLDEEKRTVAVPAYLRKIINADPKAKEAWPKLSFTTRRNTYAPSNKPSLSRRGRSASHGSCRRCVLGQAKPSQARPPSEFMHLRCGPESNAAASPSRRFQL